MSELDSERNAVEHKQVIYSLLAYPGAILAGTGSGLLLSTDQGKKWQDGLAGLGFEEPVAILCMAEQAGMIFAGTVGAVLLTPDFGERCATVFLPTPPATVSALAVSPNFLEDATVFAGTLEGGVFFSENGGQQWDVWNFGLQDYHVLSLAVSPDFAADRCVFAGTETGLFRSQNGGRSWREVKLPFGFGVILSLAVSPNFAADQTLLAGTESQGVWMSADGGQNWAQVAEQGVTEPVNGLMFLNPGGEPAALAVTSSGLWYSPAPYISWTNRLPEGFAGRELTAACPLFLEKGKIAIVAGFSDGRVEIVEGADDVCQA